MKKIFKYFYTFQFLSFLLMMFCSFLFFVYEYKSRTEIFAILGLLSLYIIPSFLNILFSIKHRFLNVFEGDNILTKFMMFIIYLSLLFLSFYFIFNLLLEEKVYLINLMLLTLFSFFNIFITFLTIQKLEINFADKKCQNFRFVKFNFKSNVLFDIIRFQTSENIEYCNGYIIINKKIITKEDLIEIENSVGKRIEQFNEDEKLIVDMYAIK
jgi:hypothetical protein